MRNKPLGKVVGKNCEVEDALSFENIMDSAQSPRYKYHISQKLKNLTGIKTLRYNYGEWFCKIESNHACLRFNGLHIMRESQITGNYLVRLSS